jgi:hypothetical protein
MSHFEPGFQTSTAFIVPGYARLLASPLLEPNNMALDLENDAFFSAAIEGLPKVVELIATVQEEKRSVAWSAAQQSYRQTAQTIGYADNDAQQWASAVMSLLEVAAQASEASASLSVQSDIPTVSGPSMIGDE